MKYKIISALLISALLFSASCSDTENNKPHDTSDVYSTTEETADSTAPEPDEQIKSINLTRLVHDTIAQLGDTAIHLGWDMRYNKDGSVALYYIGSESNYIFTIDIDNNKVISVDTVSKDNGESIPAENTNGSYTVIMDESETATHGDMYVRNEATGDIALVSKAVNYFDETDDFHLDINEYYNPIIHKFEDNKLYYTVKGYECTRGLGVYDCETGENQVYEFCRNILAVDGNTVYAINDIGDIDNIMSIYEIKLHKDSFTETKLSDPDGILPTEYMAGCEIAPQRGMIVMFDNGCINQLKISNQSISLVNSVELKMNDCFYSTAIVNESRAVVLCGNSMDFNSSDDYIYIYNLK